MNAQNLDRTANDAAKKSDSFQRNPNTEQLNSADYASPVNGNRVERTQQHAPEGNDFRIINPDSLPPERKSKMNIKSEPK